jgi:hypothetical protein
MTVLIFRPLTGKSKKELVLPLWTLWSLCEKALALRAVFFSLVQQHFGQGDPQGNGLDRAFLNAAVAMETEFGIANHG